MYMWAIQILKRGICKTPCKPIRNLAKIQMSPKHVLLPLFGEEEYQTPSQQRCEIWPKRQENLSLSEMVL